MIIGFSTNSRNKHIHSETDTSGIVSVTGVHHVTVAFRIDISINTIAMAVQIHAEINNAIESVSRRLRTEPMHRYRPDTAMIQPHCAPKPSNISCCENKLPRISAIGITDQRTDIAPRNSGN